MSFPRSRQDLCASQSTQNSPGVSQPRAAIGGLEGRHRIPPAGRSRGTRPGFCLAPPVVAGCGRTPACADKAPVGGLDVSPPTPREGNGRRGVTLSLTVTRPAPPGPTYRPARSPCPGARYSVLSGRWTPHGCRLVRAPDPARRTDWLARVGPCHLGLGVPGARAKPTTIQATPKGIRNSIRQF